MRGTFIALLAVVALASCQTPEERAAVQQQAMRPVTCQGSEDCEIKWSKALQWVLDNSAYRLQMQSDVLISTFGPSKDAASPAFTITKVPQGMGRYTFQFRAGCDNLIGCVPDLISSQASFVNAVMGP